MTLRRSRTWNPKPVDRECGGCRMCCVAPPIKEPEKVAGEACVNLGPQGCEIYAERPQVCRGFACEWLWGFGDIGQRPDRMQAMPTPAIHAGQLALYLASGLTPDTMHREAARFIRRWHRRKGTAVIVLWGDGYNMTTGIFPDGRKVTQATTWEGPLPQRQMKGDGDG